jgi:hypothetical protein
MRILGGGGGGCCSGGSDDDDINLLREDINTMMNNV